MTGKYIFGVELKWCLPTFRTLILFEPSVYQLDIRNIAGAWTTLRMAQS